MRRQLDHGCDLLRDANPGRYRDLALYLQVLRDVLPGAVEQACFHLATRYHPQRYCELPPDRRRSLHARSAVLVRRTTSLLTVEQLSRLAAGMAAERRKRQHDLLHQLHRPAGDGTSLPAAGPDDRQSPKPDSEPEGSVQLDLHLPVDPGWPALASLWAADPIENSDGLPPPDHPDALVEELSVDGEPMAPPPETPPPWDSPVLPAEPQELLIWFDGYERALVRRLRNLSHALNLELLRSGLGRSLLPLSLLEAALRGQIEPMQAPANLLRVQLPISHPSGSQLESVAVLVRPADLELEHPRLRSCRARLQRHRQEIRRMADQHRRLQRRLQALEAERLWHQDHPRYRQH